MIDGEHTSNSEEAGEGVTLQLILHCTDNQTKKVKEINFPALPCTTKQLKSAIEAQCSIPACVQTLTFESHPLVSENDLKTARVRSGDTIHVSYLSEGDCEDILQVISWMGVILATLKHESPSVSTGMSEGLNELVTYGIEFELIENLAFEYFYPWLDARKYVNKLHFVCNGGLEIMMELYSLLQREQWGQCLLKMKYLEYGILRVLWNLSETFALRRAIINLGGLHMCMRSLLRESVIKGEAIVDRQSPRGTNHDWILVENIGAALGTLCNLSELPEVHLPIGTQPAVVEQLTCISLSPSVRTMSSLLVATVFLCLAATPETHHHISTPLVIGRLIEACSLERDLKRGKDKEIDMLLLRYFSLMFLAQVALVSPHCIPNTLCTPLNHLMSGFLKTATYEQIREGEVKHWYVWQTFMPYVKLAFVPIASGPLSHEMRTLQTLSLELIVFSLQNMLGRPNHRKVLLQENLLDYIVCMPWFVPEPVKPRVQELVQMLASYPDMNMQPPTLLCGARAILAKAHFGLEKAVALSVGEIVTKILPIVEN